MLDEYILIDLIKEHEELYNRDHPEYMNQQLRENTWREIANKLGENSTVCKEKWHRIRENFRKAIILRRQKMEAGAKIRPPKYHKQMSFLLPHLGDDNSFSMDQLQIEESADTGGDGDEQSDSSLSNPVPRKVIKRSHSDNELTTEEVMIFDNTQQNQTKTDPVLTDFFINMANTVSKFPLNKQLEIKGKLFKMVHDTEIEMAKIRNDVLFS